VGSFAAASGKTLEKEYEDGVEEMEMEEGERCSACLLVRAGACFIPGFNGHLLWVCMQAR
jgi:hypothetical protein